MTSDLIHDRGRGPEIVGTRITVYNLLQSFLDPTVTEDEICRIYDLTARQVAAARAYVLGNPDTVLAEHLKIEQRLAAGNSPEVRAHAGARCKCCKSSSVGSRSARKKNGNTSRSTLIPANSRPSANGWWRAMDDEMGVDRDDEPCMRPAGRERPAYTSPSPVNRASQRVCVLF